MTETLLVTGAAGQLGRRVMTHLLETCKVPAGRIVGATRTPDRIADFSARGVVVRRADFDDPASLASAFSGVSRILIISTDAIDRPGRRLEQHKAAVRAAIHAGITHIVYTSMPNPDDTLVPFAPDHLGTEQAIAASGASWTILRNSWYMEGFLRSLAPVLASGKWFTSAGNGRAAHVAREDCARAAAYALASESTANQRYDIAGPKSLTTVEIAAIASEVLQKPIDVVQVTDEQLTQGMVATGMPEALAAFWTIFDANTRAGKVDVRSDAIKKLTGREPQTLRDFLVANRASLDA